MDSTNLIPGILRSLLVEHNRISIPGVGGFVAEYCAARPATDRKTFLPPCKQFTFSTHEIWNDERLEKQLAVRSGCSFAEAREQIAFWVDDICYQLATSKSVVLENIGVLAIDDDNTIRFQQDAGVNFLKNSFGLESVEFRYIPILVEEAEEPLACRKGKKSFGWLLFLALLLSIAGLLVYLYHH